MRGDEGNGVPGWVARELDDLKRWRNDMIEWQISVARTQGMVALLSVVFGAAAGAIVAAVLK